MLLVPGRAIYHRSLTERVQPAEPLSHLKERMGFGLSMWNGIIHAGSYMSESLVPGIATFQFTLPMGEIP